MKLEEEMAWQEKIGEYHPEDEMWVARKFYLLVLAIVTILAILVVAWLSPFVRGYSDLTQEIHRYTSCSSDGFCRPEVYVVLDDPMTPGSIQVDYVPSVDEWLWTITLRGIVNATVDAQENYDQRGCLEFFQDCPSTDHDTWLRRQDTLVVDIDTDTYLDTLRIVNVPMPRRTVLMDGHGAHYDLRPNEGEVWLYDTPVGLHRYIFYMQPGPEEFGSTFRLIPECADNAFLLVLRCRDVSPWVEGANVSTVCFRLDGGVAVCTTRGGSVDLPSGDSWFAFGVSTHVLQMNATYGNGVTFSRQVFVETSGLPRLLLLSAILLLAVLLVAGRKRRKKR